MPTMRQLPRRLRHLSNSAAGRVGVLHVYRLELAERPPPGQRVRLLFPAGTPPTDEESAARLAAAAERGDAVLVPERVVHKLLGDQVAQMQVAALPDKGAEARALPSGDASHGSSPTGGDSMLKPSTSSAASATALALADASVPLSSVLSGGGVSHPDWRATADLGEHDAARAPSASAAQQAVLAAAAGTDAARLADAIAACPSGELSSAVLTPSGATALHLAATAGSLPAVRMLLDAGASVHTLAANGSSALHWAAGSGHSPVVQALLSAGASTRARSSTWRSTVRGNDSGQTPAHWAAASGHTGALELLLAEDPHALLLEDERDMSLAALAARDGHPWLQSALEGLREEKVVCVRISREATLQRPLDDLPVDGKDDGDADVRTYLS